MATDIERKRDPRDPHHRMKEFDLKEHKWLINGKWYYLLTKMPPRRYVEYLKLLPETVFSTSFTGMYETLQQIWQNSTSGNDIIAAMHSNAELAYNQIKSIVDFTQRDHPKILEFCAVILCREDEDLKELELKDIEDKVSDFMADSYTMESFFLLAQHSIPHFTTVYNRLRADLTETAMSKDE